MLTVDRLEVLSKYFVQGMTSGYWVLAALVLPIDTYGNMMLVYATVTLISNLLRIRSFDLFFWMLRSYRAEPEVAFFRTFSYEIALTGILFVIVAPLHLAAPKLLFPDGAGPVLAIFMVYSLGNMAGSAMAILREEQATKLLLVGDLISSAFWIAAIIVLFVLPDLPPNEILLIGVTALVSRPVALHGLHFLRAPRRYTHRPVPWRRTEVAFIAKGHITNVIKNNAIAIEVLLLGMVSNAQTVGFYRLARSVLSLALIGLNISYQKILRSLGTKVEGDVVRDETIRRLERFNWLLYLAGLFMGITALGAFSLFKEEAPIALSLTTFCAVWVSQLPAVVQQIPFAVAVIRADYWRIFLAWSLGLAVICTFVLLSEEAGVVAFCTAVLAGGLVRVCILIFREGRRGIPFKIKLVRVALTTHLRLLDALFRRRSIILNYQMGKVGSSTVARYLRESGAVEWHIHRFYDTPIAVIRSKQRVFKAMDLILLWLVRRFASKVYLIAGVRDPRDRDVAMFFQTAQALYGVDPEKTDLDSLYNTFLDQFPLGAVDNWFDDELNRALGIDVFATTFDKDLGFIQLHRGRINVFVYRLDKLDSLENELAIFFGDENYRLIDTNVNGAKSYAKTYLAFKKRYFGELAKKYEHFTKIRKHFYAEKLK
jgi:hypothetical protein